MYVNYTTLHPMTHQMPASVTTTHARPSQPDEMAVVAASGEGGRGHNVYDIWAGFILYFIVVK